MAAAGDRVVFDCAETPYAEAGTAICEVSIAGGAVRLVASPETMGAAGGETALHHASYAPDGSILFEAEIGTERIWRVAPGASDPVLVTDAFPNDNAPCVLPDGRIASLWLLGPDNPEGVHELKVMEPDGRDWYIQLPGVDVDDIGYGCGR